MDRYEIVEHVADGGMGTVWRARLQGMHGFTKDVALKTITYGRTDDADAQALLLEEARISSKLSHANVAQLLDVGQYAGGTYLVFEWMDGKSLEDICRSHEARGERIPFPRLLRILAETCAGLHTAHELTDGTGALLNLVHRDVTPSNILVSDKGFSKIIDFGIAKARDRHRIATHTGMVRGTPRYMSPEQACKEPVDRRADVWSLGAVMFRCLAGEPPLRTPHAFASYLGSGEVPPLPVGVPLDIREICMRALQREPGNRFATAKAMRDALEESLQRAKASAHDAPPAGLAIANAPVISGAQIAELAHADTALQPALASNSTSPAATTARAIPANRGSRPLRVAALIAIAIAVAIGLLTRCRG